jgi:hypothetical protein
VVDAQGKVHLRTVVIGKDFGSKVQIASGLSARQKVIDNPPDALLDGDAVKVVAPPRRRRPWWLGLVVLDLPARPGRLLAGAGL